MSTTTSHTSELDAWLPDHKVTDDLRQIVENGSDGFVEYDSGAVKVPPEADYEVLSKAFIKQPASIGFGSCFRAVIAIGGATEAAGILKAKFGFATVWYSATGELITTDFSEVTPI